MAAAQIGRLTSSMERLAKEKVELETQLEAEEEQVRSQSLTRFQIFFSRLTT